MGYEFKISVKFFFNANLQQLIQNQHNLGGWEKSHDLQYERHWHSSWVVDEGIILMGGDKYKEGRNNAEIAKWDGTTEKLFDMKYETG